PRRSGIEGDVALQDRVVEEEGHPPRDLQALPMRVAEVEGRMVDVAIGDRAVLASASPGLGEEEMAGAAAAEDLARFDVDHMGVVAGQGRRAPLAPLARCRPRLEELPQRAERRRHAAPSGKAILTPVASARSGSGSSWSGPPSL